MAKPLITQRNWRIAGGIFLACSAYMAYEGGDVLRAGHSTLYLLGYWGLFLVFLLAAFYVVVLDIRYIRLQYLLAQRDAFHHTIGSEDFRRALYEAERKRNSDSPEN